MCARARRRSQRGSALTDDYVQIREMMEQYQKKYGKSMEKATRSETSFWYRRALVYAIRMASEPVVLVPQNQLVRLRDV